MGDRTIPKAVPKYRHRASGQAIVTIQGRDHYLGPHGTKASKAEYDRLVTEWLASGRPSVPEAQSSDLFGDRTDVFTDTELGRVKYY